MRAVKLCTNKILQFLTGDASQYRLTCTTVIKWWRVCKELSSVEVADYGNAKLTILLDRRHGSLGPTITDAIKMASVVPLQSSWHMFTAQTHAYGL